LQKPFVAQDLTPEEIWALARDKEGCRQVQRALTEAASDDERIALATVFHGHVREAMRCANANYVLQKCIETMRPVDSQFILDEIGPFAGEVARHRYGVRLLQRLLEHFLPTQMYGIVEELLVDGVALSMHIYANFLMQHILEHGTDSQQIRLAMLLAENASTVCGTTYGCSVVTKALECAGHDAKTALANALLLLAPHVLADVACLRHGHLTVKLALQAASAAQRKAVFTALANENNTLSKSRYGRTLKKYLDECWVEECSGECN